MISLLQAGDSLFPTTKFVNIKISQFAADFIKDLRTHLGGDPRIPHLTIRNFGYLYLASDPTFADTLQKRADIQREAGAATEILSKDQIANAYPFYNLDDILLGSINLVDEGYFDAMAMFDWTRRSAQARGVERLRLLKKKKKMVFRYFYIF